MITFGSFAVDSYLSVLDQFLNVGAGQFPGEIPGKILVQTATAVI